MSRSREDGLDVILELDVRRRHGKDRVPVRFECLVFDDLHVDIVTEREDALKCSVAVSGSDWDRKLGLRSYFWLHIMFGIRIHL